MESTDEPKGTLCCILCRGTVNFKRNDPAVFRNHMKDQHNAFYQLDYMLASCFLPGDDLDRVSQGLKYRPLEREEMEVNEQEDEQEEDQEVQEVDQEEQEEDQEVEEVDQEEQDEDQEEQDEDQEEQDEDQGEQEGNQEEQEDEEVSLREETEKQQQAGKREAEGELEEGQEVKKRKFGGFQCEKCDKRYTSKNNLNLHEKKHHGAAIKQERFEAEGSDVEESFEEEQGDQSMDGVSQEGEDEESAEGKKAFACKICPKSYGSKTGLKQHIVAKHGQENLGDIVCNFCPRTFISDQGLVLHKARKHKGGIAEEAVSEFACEYDGCGKSFPKSNTLRAHEISVHKRVPGPKGRRPVKKEANVFQYSSEDFDDSSEIDISVEDVNLKYADVPADSDASLNISDVAAVDNSFNSAAEDYNTAEDTPEKVNVATDNSDAATVQYVENGAETIQDILEDKLENVEFVMDQSVVSTEESATMDQDAGQEDATVGKDNNVVEEEASEVEEEVSFKQVKTNRDAEVENEASQKEAKPEEEVAHDEAKMDEDTEEEKEASCGEAKMEDKAKMDEGVKVGEEAITEEANTEKAVSQKAVAVGDAPPPREHCTVCQEAIPAKFMELHMSHYHRDILIEQLTRKDEPAKVTSAPARVPARNPPTLKTPKTSVSADPSTGRFTCAFDCGKSFAQKSNLANHEIKVHNRPKMKKGRNDRKSTEGGYDTADDEAEEEDSEPAKVVKKVAEEQQGPEAAAEDSSFLTDTSFENQTGDEDALPGGDLQDKEDREQKPGVLDLKSSEYFTKYPKAIANPQERSLKLFTEPAQGLPAGWKVRTLKDPKDESRIVRHFLSPDMRVLKTSQGVVEYLRMEGALEAEEILAIARGFLKLTEKKINALYN